MHLANVVRADRGDGLESQLLAADAHEDLFHLAQEILLYICRQKQKMHYSWKNNLKTMITFLNHFYRYARLPSSLMQECLIKWRLFNRVKDDLRSAGNGAPTC